MICYVLTSIAKFKQAHRYLLLLRSHDLVGLLDALHLFLFLLDVIQMGLLYYLRWYQRHFLLRVRCMMILRQRILWLPVLLLGSRGARFARCWSSLGSSWCTLGM